MDPQKKRQQLSQRKKELALAFKKHLPDDKLQAFVERYRLAQIGMLKAQLHEKREREFEKKRTMLSEQKITKEIEVWKNKAIEEIIAEAKKSNDSTIKK